MKIIWVKIYLSVEKNKTNTKSAQLTRWMQLKIATIISLIVYVFIKQKS